MQRSFVPAFGNRARPGVAHDEHGCPDYYAAALESTVADGGQQQVVTQSVLAPFLRNLFFFFKASRVFEAMDSDRSASISLEEFR